MLDTLLVTAAMFVANPSSVHVEQNIPAVYHSVQYFDNKINVTNRVLDRSIVKDVVRVQPLESSSWDTLTQDQKDARARQMLIRQTRNLQATSTHCQLRLVADGISNPSGECGRGIGQR